MDIGPIPAASIERATAEMGEADAILFRACIRAMDDEVFRHRRGEKPEPEPERTVTPELVIGLFGGQRSSSE